jgi:uncharacterized iron-regulated membrane protein
VTFTIDWGIVNRPDQRARIDVNIATGKAKAPKLPPTTFAEQFPLWIKGIHTGEAFGIVGQTIVMLAAIGTTFLVWTGLALMLRRNATWRTRRARKRAGILEPPPALA